MLRSYHAWFGVALYFAISWEQITFKRDYADVHFGLTEPVLKATTPHKHAKH